MAFKKILGLWKKQDKNGNDYLGGKVSQEIVIPAGAFLMLRKNDRKDSDNHPDYQITMATDDK